MTESNENWFTGVASRYAESNRQGRDAYLKKRREVTSGDRLFETYKRLSENGKTRFRELLEEDWREHHKFEGPVEEIVDAEIIEDGW